MVGKAGEIQMMISIFLSHLYSIAEQKGCTAAEAMREALGCGITRVEADFAQADGCEEELNALLKQNGLQVGGMYGFFDFAHCDEEERAARFVRCAARMGAASIMPLPGTFLPDEDRAAARERMACGLRALCRKAADAGIPTVLEEVGMPDKAPGRTAELMWFLRRIPELGCTFDTGNFYYHDEDVLAAYDALRGRVAHVHLKDHLPEPLLGESGAASDAGRVFYPAPIGHGVLPLAQIVTGLLADGYRGIFAIEHFGAKDQSLFMHRSAEWLRQFDKPA